MTLYMGLQKITPAILSNESVSKKYSLLQRIRDDSYNEIGTVSGFVTDSNNNEYAVVCLDSQYRGTGQLLTSNVEVDGAPALNDWSVRFWGSYKTSATENCDRIANFCTQEGYTSTAIDFCRNKSFTIDDVTYYGQAPTAKEVYDIMYNKTAIDAADITAATYPSLSFASSRNMLTSSIYVSNYILFFNTGGRMADAYITASNFIAPVLELPNIKTNYLKFTSRNENIVERCTYTTLYNGVSVDANSSYGRASFIFPVSQGKTYVLEFDSSYVDGYHMVYFSDTALNSGDPWDPSYTSMSIGGHKTYTFTSTSDVFWIGIYASANTSSGNITLTNVSLTETQS